MAKSTPITEALISDPKITSQIVAAKLRIQEAKTKPALLNTAVGESKDDQGRSYLDIQKVRKTLSHFKDEQALAWHKNDPNIRLDACGFPTIRKARHFLLTHNFKAPFTRAYNAFRHEWIYIHGTYGNGKTSLAIRIMWEIMKQYPSLQPSFLPVNAWVNSLMPKEETQPLPTLRKFIILDDFDKFNFQKEFQRTHVLRLIEKLIHDDHRVIFTANRQITDLIKLSKDLEFNAILDRLRGMSFEMQAAKGESKR